jgi:hypothetical protein
MRARGRLSGYDEAQANNLEDYPDPALPTYEGLDAWQEGPYVVRHVSVPFAHIDYEKHTINGYDVDPATVRVLPMTAVVTGKRDAQFLIDFGDGTGSIYDADEDWLYPPRGVATLAAQGYWENPGTLPPAVEQLLTDLNAASAPPGPGEVAP